MNKKLIILVGISGSGKSHFSKLYLKEHPDTVRVNRDDIRKQLMGELKQEYYSKENESIRAKLEKHITVVHNEQIKYWLQQGYNVVVDNTHLKKEYILDYKENFQYLADIHIKMFPCDPDLCIGRVIEREGSVDVSYINRQAKQFEKLSKLFFDGEIYPQKEIVKPEWDRSLPNCWIVDIDGTIADCTGVRSPYDGSKLHLDKPIVPVRELVYKVCNSSEVVYLSGREDKWKEGTIKWINDNGFPFNEKIYMRKTGDRRKDSIVKRELYENHIKGKYNVWGVVDDRKQVKPMWVKEGLFVFDVNQFDRIF